MSKMRIALCLVLGATAAQADAAPPVGNHNHSPSAAEVNIRPCAYPPEAKGDEVGTTLVHVWLDDKGSPTKTSITTSSGYHALDVAALECAKASTWDSAERAGKAETDTRFEWTGGPLPQTCEAPSRRNSVLTMRIRLTAEAASKVVFEHPKATGTLPAGVMGQAMICACVDKSGNVEDPVRLMRPSGSPVLDSESIEIAKNLEYPSGNPGCMRDTINFSGPND